MTTRTRTAGAYSRSWKRTIDKSPAGAIQSDSGVVFSGSQYNADVRTMTDTVVPGFKKLVAKGHIFMNPYSQLKDDRSTTVVNLGFGPHPSWGTREISGSLACEWSIPPSYPAWFDQRVADAKARTLLRAHSKVASEEFLALVTVAEAHKTASMLAKPFSVAQKLLEQMVRRKATLVSKGLTALSAASAAWLEYRFGWRPVIQDIQGIAKAWYDAYDQHETPVRRVARASDKNIVWISHGNVSKMSRPGTTEVTMVADYERAALVSSGVLYQLQDENLGTATARRMGLRLSDVPASAWELVPYSFVVDRFVDVGVWLNAITPKPGVSILGSWTVVRDQKFNFHKLTNVRIDVATAPATSYSHTDGGVFNERIITVQRSANPSLPPLPTVNYRDLNLSQMVDHVALLNGLFKGFKVRS